MSKPTKKALALLRAIFNHTTKTGEVLRGYVSASDHSEGTLPLWGQLAQAGLVEPVTRGILGHKFHVKLTDAGRTFLQEENRI